MHTSLKLPYFLRNIISNLKTPKNRQSRNVYQEEEEEEEGFHCAEMTKCQALLT